MQSPDAREAAVPRRALGFSLAALAAPVAAALFAPAEMAQYSALLWLTALLPAFLLAYYRGWQGVATSLALGMAALSVSQAGALALGRTLSDLILPVVVVYLGISLAIGWLASQLRQERAEATDMAFTDTLTGLPNRRHADIFLRDEFAASRRGRVAAVVLFDLDGFKRFNDTEGHAAGDAALRAFADVLRRNTRRMNLAARFGGEEFVAILAGSYPRGAWIFADRVRTALEAQGIGSPPLTVSAGIAVYTPEIESEAALLAAADAALYEAKRGGRNRVEVAGGLPAEDEGPPIVPGFRAGSPPPLPAPTRGPAADPGAGPRRVLVVDGDPSLAQDLARVLAVDGFEVTSAGTAPEGLQALTAEVDVVVTDMHLPGGSGQDIVREARARWPRVQILVITALQDARVAADAVNAGADRYLFKPFSVRTFRDHMEAMIRRRAEILRDAVDARPLDAEGRDRAERTRRELEKAARGLVQAVESRDPFTRGHGLAVADHAVALATHAWGPSPALDLDLLRLACEVHDVGKIAVPDQILNKPSPLTPEEFAVVRGHTRAGRRILEPLLPDDLILDGVTWHHEWWDGSGYPDHLSGEGIPPAARVIALADVVDALTHARAFRPAMPWDTVVERIRQDRGRRFDPVLVDAFLAHVEEFRARALALPAVSEP